MADIDYSFTFGEEGGIKGTDGSIDHTIAYYPGDSQGSGKSGLTIGHGIDLSHFTEKDLLGWGVSKKDVNNVKDFLAPASGGYGVKGPILGTKTSSYDIYNRDIFGNRMLGKGKKGYKYSWSEESVDAATKGLYGDYLNSAKNTYEGLSKKKWKNLSKAQKTVLFDITINAGPNFINKTNTFKNHIANNDWKGIEAELRSKNWAEKDKARHVKRANLLKLESIKKSKKDDTSFFFPDENVMNEALG